MTTRPARLASRPALAVLALLLPAALVGCGDESATGSTAASTAAASAASASDPAAAAPVPGTTGSDSGSTAGAPPPSHPSTTEVCDGIDNDGDGEVDEEDAGCFDTRDCAQEAVADPTVTHTTSSHAIWLPGIHGQLQFHDDARFVQNSDGTASITGTLAPPGAFDRGFMVEIDLTGHSFSTPPGMPVKELMATAYAPAGPVDPSTWVYYHGLQGTLTGFGEWSGAVVDVVDSGMGAQVGDGASGRTTDPGFASWIEWTLTTPPWDGSLSWDSSGHGDINLVTGTCEDCVDVDLGEAADHNVFVFKNYRYGLDVEGRVAAGNRVEMTGFSVGWGIGSGQVLTSGNRVDLKSGTVHGVVTYANAAAISTSVNMTGGPAVQATPIDFATEQADLETLSTDLAALAPTGHTEVSDYGQILLQGTDPSVNIFTLDGDDFIDATYLKVEVPSGSTVIVNVDGTVINSFNFYWDFVGATEANTLWNFHEATWLGLGGMNVRGSVLAPWAIVDFDNGAFDGNIIAASLLGTAEGHLASFTGAGPACE